MNTVMFFVDDETSEDDFENTIMFFVDEETSEDDFENIVGFLVDDETSRADYGIANPTTGNGCFVIPSDDDSSNGADDESAAHAISTSNAATPVSNIYHDKSSETNKENATTTVDRISMERLLKEQAEETRTMFANLAANTEIDQDTASFAKTAAGIIERWQKYAEEKNPTSYRIDFGMGSPINLLTVLALLPEEYQSLIYIEDKHRSPSGNEENMSWLHEETMELLVKLSMDPCPGPISFGQGLASMIRDDVDEGWRRITGRSWLEDQLHLWSTDELEPDLYRFPPQTEKIVFFFNPTEIHWTVVEVNLDDDVWTYTLYNSLFQGERGATWSACQVQFPLLEQLICRASGFMEPKSRTIVNGSSFQQENTYDCGPIAVCNAIQLLHERSPKRELDPEKLRLKYLMLILKALGRLGE